ncbi:MAG: hypothetical protein BM556_07845 [Bacteriovorax sp. MedPE-SWde]|nr:MAG: hypothetical protein BM556_07845 [Bacteriovorax sp. MedPE-SWde]
MTDDTPKNEDQDLLERLQNDIDEAIWEIIEPHHNRESAYLLSSDLELAPVGMAMAKDQIEYIRGWLTDGSMARPNEEQIKVWKEQDVKFNYLIVQPYVLIQVKQDELQ